MCQSHGQPAGDNTEITRSVTNGARSERKHTCCPLRVLLRVQILAPVMQKVQNARGCQIMRRLQCKMRGTDSARKARGELVHGPDRAPPEQQHNSTARREGQLRGERVLRWLCACKSWQLCATRVSCEPKGTGSAREGGCAIKLARTKCAQCVRSKYG